MFKKAWFVLCAINMFFLFSTSVLADLVLSEGGASGQWWNPTRDGEGIFFEIVVNSSGSLAAVAWFTYDMDGTQMWLSGAIEISDDATSVNIPVIVTDGPVFGSGYDPTDLNVESWGTLILSFDTCDSGSLAFTSSAGFGDGAILLSRLTSLEQVRCTEPPTTPQIKTGRWQGDHVCFYVGPDGRSITEVGSTCDANQAFDSDLTGLSAEEGVCESEVECEGAWAISNGSFVCETSNEVAVGSFISETEASGLAMESDGAFDGVCTAAWRATADD